MTNLNREFYSIRDLSDLFRISTRTVWKLIKEHDLETLHIGRKAIIPKKEVQRIIDTVIKK